MGKRGDKMRNLLAKFLLIALIVVGVLINSEPVQAAYAEAGVYTPSEGEWTRTYNDPGYNFNLSIAPPAGQAIIGYSVTAKQAYTNKHPLFYAYAPNGQYVYISGQWEVAGLTRYVRCQNPITTSAQIHVYNPNSYPNNPVLPFIVNIHYGVPVADGDEVTAAKTAALAAQTAANNALTKINNTTYGLEAINNKINNLDTKINNINTKIESLSTPVITKVSTVNGATASTTGQSPPIIVNASGADKFGLSLDGTNWLDGFDINTGGSISGLSSGVNNIRVRAYDSSVPAEKRKYAYGNILIFGL